ncbi:MAG: hypothetical protein M3Z85_05350 [Acidobacteriota bacterium]|nr:hypothetical protein [Acidobacteriota bacterium]
MVENPARLDQRRNPASFLAYLALIAVAGPAALSGASLLPADVAVGQNLQTTATVALSEAAPKEGVAVTVKSGDSSRFLLSKSEERSGSAEIVLQIPGGGIKSQEFYVQGLVADGAAMYTATAPGYGSKTANVTLAPSAILISGPSRLATSIATTPRRWGTKIMVYSAQVDRSGKFVEVQPVRGGFSAKVAIESSSPSCGAVTPASFTIASGMASEAGQFVPAALGETTLSVAAPAGFGKATQFHELKVTVALPGMAIAGQISLGHNLQVGGNVQLGSPAPPGGLQVTLTSGDPGRLLLSAAPNNAGTKTITLHLPEGGMSVMYYLQGIADSGTVSHTALAAGYRDGAGVIRLTPSGVLIAGPTGPPDEAEVLRPNAPRGPSGLFSSLGARRPTPISIYTAHLDPVTHRCADITVQPLRAGLSLKVVLKNSNPAIGTVGESVTIAGGTEQGGTEFNPLSLGTTEISLLTPEGYTTPTNATSLTAVVRQ